MMENKIEMQCHAGFFIRAAAYIIDYILINTALWVLRIPMWVLSWTNPEHLLVRELVFGYSIVDIFIYVLTAAYFVIFTYKSGATFGKKMMHLRVVSMKNEETTLFTIIFRETIGRLISMTILGIGYFIVGFRKDKRGLHDLMSNTRVIYCIQEQKDQSI